MRCTKVIPQQEITLGRKHTIREDLHVVPLDSDIILGGPWIFSLGCFRFDLPNLKIHFEHKGEEITLEGIPDGSAKLVSCKRIERTLRHGRGECVEQCLILNKSTPQYSAIHIAIEPIIKKHRRVFEEIPLGLPPKRGFEHIIELEKDAKLVITTPYHHPKKYKDEIEKAI